MSSLLRRTGPFAHRNPRLYVLFTLLYNARAYYPVLAIFFTDLGLTLDDFETCRGCPDRAFCGRNSGVVYTNTGEYTGPEPFTCNRSTPSSRAISAAGNSLSR